MFEIDLTNYCLLYFISYNNIIYHIRMCVPTVVPIKRKKIGFILFIVLHMLNMHINIPLFHNNPVSNKLNILKVSPLQLSHTVLPILRLLMLY